MAERLSIIERTRELEFAPSLAKDFTLGASRAFDASEVLLSGIDGHPRYTLYCLDPSDGTALFVETPKPGILEEAPFFYAAQYEHAQAVVKLTREEFFHLAGETPDPSPLLAFVQSVGRSGTTLASRAFGTCVGVYSLSEPDVLLQVLALSPGSPGGESPWSCKDEDAYDELIDACMRLLCGEALRSGRYHRLIIKPRSQFCEAFSAILRLYPNAETLFLSRAPMSWIRSVFSALLRDLDGDDEKVLRSFETSLGSYIPLIQSRITSERPQSMGALWALHYVSALREFEAARQGGLSAYVSTFEELQECPRRQLEIVFERWGLEWNNEALIRVLDQDSQEGSGLSREGEGRSEYVVPPHHVENAAAVFREFGIL